MENPWAKSRYDLIFETDRECNLEAIANCARNFGHEILIEYITVEDKSYHGGNPADKRKHP